MGPLSNLNILPFQNNMEELVCSFHSLPIPPYNLNTLNDSLVLYVSIKYFMYCDVCTLYYEIVNMYIDFRPHMI